MAKEIDLNGYTGVVVNALNQKKKETKPTIAPKATNTLTVNPRVQAKPSNQELLPKSPNPAVSTQKNNINPYTDSSYKKPLQMDSFKNEYTGKEEKAPKLETLRGETYLGDRVKNAWVDVKASVENYFKNTGEAITEEKPMQEQFSMGGSSGSPTFLFKIPKLDKGYVSDALNAKALEDTYGDFENMPAKEQIKYRQFIQNTKELSLKKLAEREDARERMADYYVARQKRMLDIEEKYEGVEVPDFFKFSADVISNQIDQLPVTAGNILTGGMATIPLTATKIHSDAMSEAFAELRAEHGDIVFSDPKFIKEANDYAFLQASIETGIETLFGGMYGSAGLSDIYEEPLKKAIAKASASEAFKEFLVVGINVLGEGIEEFLTEIATYATAKYTYKGADKRKAPELIQDALYSGLVGMFSAGTSQLVRFADIRTSALKATLKADDIGRLSVEEQQALFNRATGKNFRMVSKEEMGIEALGKYDPATDEIIVSSESKNPFQTALLHEFTHSLQVSGLYEDYQARVINYINENSLGGIDALIDARKKLYKEKGNQILTDQMAIDEVVSDFTQQVLFSYSMDGKNIMSKSAIEMAFTGNKSISQHILNFFAPKAFNDYTGYFRDLQELYGKVIQDVNAKETELRIENQQRALVGLQPLTKTFLSDEFDLSQQDLAGTKLTRDERIFFKGTKAQEMGVLKPVTVEVDGEVKKGYVRTQKQFDKTHESFDEIFEAVTKDMGEVDFDSLTKEQAEKILSRISLSFDSVPYNLGSSYVVRNANQQFREFGHDYTNERSETPEVRLSIKGLINYDLTPDTLGDAYRLVVSRFNQSELLASFKKYGDTGFIYEDIEAFKEEYPDKKAELDRVLKYAEETLKNIQFTNDTDAVGNPITIAQKQAFSEVSDYLKYNGKLLPFYHGTMDNFESFDYERLGQHDSIHTEGFYFASSYNYATRYAKYGSDNPIILESYLNLKNPIPTNEKTYIDGNSIVSKYKEMYLSYLNDLDIDNKAEISKLFNETVDKYAEFAVPQFTNGYNPDVYRIRDLANLMTMGFKQVADKYGGLATSKQALHGAFYGAVKSVTGKDGVVSLNQDGTPNFVVAWFNNQIKSVDNLTPDMNSSNMFDNKPMERYSLKEESVLDDSVEQEAETAETFDTFARNVMANWKNNEKYSSLLHKYTKHPDWGKMRDVWEQSKLRKQAKEAVYIPPKKAVDNFKKSAIFDKLNLSWAVDVDSDVKADIYDEVIKDKTLRDSLLSIMYDNYLSLYGKDSKSLPFDKFLNQEVTLYRGQPSSKRLVEQDRFVSYTFSLDTALDFASFDSQGDYRKNVDSIKIKPMDTFGSFSSITQKTGQYNEFEIMVPRTVVRENSAMFNKFSIDPEKFSGMTNFKKPLTDAQKEFYGQASRHVFDKNGDLITLYHSTNKAGWTIPSGSKGAGVVFMTPNMPMSLSYANSANLFDAYKVDDEKNALFKKIDELRNEMIFGEDSLELYKEYLEEELAVFNKINGGKGNITLEILDGESFVEGYVFDMALLETSIRIKINDTNEFGEVESVDVRDLYDSNKEFLVYIEGVIEDNRIKNRSGVYKMHANFKHPLVLDYTGIEGIVNWSALEDYWQEDANLKRFLADNDESFDSALKFISQTMRPEYLKKSGRRLTTDQIIWSVVESNKKGKTNFDGVIIKGISDYADFEGIYEDVPDLKAFLAENKADVFVSLQEGVVKDYDNETPTTNPDIRYLLREGKTGLEDITLHRVYFEFDNLLKKKHPEYFRRMDLMEDYNALELLGNTEQAKLLRDSKYLEFKRDLENKKGSALTHGEVIRKYAMEERPKTSELEKISIAKIALKHIENSYGVLTDKILPYLPPYDIQRSRASGTSVSFYLHFDQKYFDEVAEFVGKHGEVIEKNKTVFENGKFILRVSDHPQYSDKFGRDKISMNISVLDMGVIPLTPFQSKAILNPEEVAGVPREILYKTGFRKNPRGRRLMLPTNDIEIPMDNKRKRLSEQVSEWSKNSKARDKNGRLMRVYHGTFFDFDEFKLDLIANDGAVGRGIYVTNNKMEATRNYAGESGDTASKFMRYIDKLVKNGMSEESAYAEAEKVFSNGRVIEAYINIVNPFVISNPDSIDNEILFGRTFGEELYEEGMDVDTFTGLVEDEIVSLYEEVEEDLYSRGIVQTRDYEGSTMLSAMADSYYNGGETFFELAKKLVNYGFEDADGNDATPEVLRTIIEHLGYDGIIDKTFTTINYESGTKFIYDPDYGTTLPVTSDHFILFNPNQIKYITNENPTDSPDMRYSIQRTQEEMDALQQAVIDKFGITENINHTGWLLRNGKYLNMPVGAGMNTDKNALRMQHDIVEQVVSMTEFITTMGNIRIRPEGNIVQIMKKPSQEQMVKLQEVFGSFKEGSSAGRGYQKNSVYISLWDVDNPKYWYGQTPDITEKSFAVGSVQEMMDFVDGFYSGKVKQYESPFAEFREKMMILQDAKETDEPEIVEAGEKIVPHKELFDGYSVEVEKDVFVPVYTLNRENLQKALFFSKTYYKAPTSSEKNQANRILEKHRTAPSEAEIASNRKPLTDEEVRMFAQHIADGGFTATADKTILKPKGWDDGKPLKPNEKFDTKTYVAVRHIYEGETFNPEDPDYAFLKQVLEDAYANLRFNDEYVGAWVENGKLYLDISVGINQGKGSHADRVAKLIGDQITGIKGVGEQTVFNMKTGTFPRLKANIEEDAFIKNILEQSYLDSPAEIVEKAKALGIKLKVSKHAITAQNAGLGLRTVNRVEKDIEEGKLTYVPHTDKEAITFANEKIGLKLSDSREAQIATLEKARDDLYALFNSGVRLNKNHIATGEVLIREFARLQQSKSASELIGVVATIGTELGQQVQAMSLIRRLSPSGQLMTLRRVVERMRTQALEAKRKMPTIEFDAELEARIMAETDQEKIDALMDEYKDKIAQQIPVRLMDKLNAWRYMSMLGNARTHLRNIAGNATFTPMVMMKELVGTVLESAFIDQSQRTKSVLNPVADRALIEFAKRDAQTMIKNDQKEGKYSNKNDLLQRRKIFKNVPMEWFREKNFELLALEDSIFKSIHYTRTLAQFIKARGWNINSITVEQLQQARTHALLEADKATFNDASEFASMLNTIARKGGVGGFLIESIVPFKKTPINITKRAFEYSPAQLVASITYDAMLVKQGKMTATEYIDKMASGLTGTAVAVLGAFLYNLGLFNAGEDDEESDKKNLYDRQMGTQNYSLTIGDSSYTLDWLTPAVMPLSVGAEIQKAIMNYEKDDNLFKYGSEAIISIFDPIFEMTMLQGLTESLQSYKDGAGKLSDILAQTSANFLNQFIPTFSGQVARSIDDTRRSTFASKDSLNPFVESTLRKMANKIPFASMLNEPYIDIQGNPQKNAGDNIMTRLLLNMFSPGYYAENKSTRADKEIQRLYEATKNNDAIPKTVPKEFNYNDDQMFRLNGEDYTQFAETLGKTSYEIINKLVDNKYYSRMDTETKVKTFADAYEYANDKAKNDVLFKNGKTYVDNTFKKQNEAVKAGIPIVDYLAIKQQFDTMSGEDKKQKFIDYLYSVGLGDKLNLYMKHVGQYKGYDDEEVREAPSTPSTKKPETKTEIKVETAPSGLQSFTNIIKKGG